MPELRGQRSRPRVGVVGGWGGEEEAALRVLFRAVTFHPTLADLEGAWSRHDLDLVVIAEYADGVRTGRFEHLSLSPMKDVHLIVFGTPFHSVPFHHERTLHRGQPARSSEHVVGDPQGAVRRVLRRSMDGVRDVREWPTISLQAMAPLATQHESGIYREKLEDRGGSCQG